MLAEITSEWRWISIEYETVLMVLLEKSDGMISIPSTNATMAIVIKRRRDSGAMGLSPPGSNFFRPDFSFGGVLTLSNLGVNCYRRTGACG